MGFSRRYRRGRAITLPAPSFIAFLDPLPGEPCVICQMLGRCTIHQLGEPPDDDHCVQNVEEASARTETSSATDSNSTGAISGHRT